MTAVVPLFLLMASVTTLAACSPGKPTGMSSTTPETASQQASMSTAPVQGAQSTVAASGIVAPTMDAPLNANEEAGIYARLARLENDVASMKGQISQIAPALEKMPDIQVKLGELVSELKNLDSRVEAAKAHAEDLPDVTPKPTSKPLALAPVEPSVKPAPAKGLMTPGVSSSSADAMPKPETKPEQQADVKKSKIIPMKSETASAPKATESRVAVADDGRTKVQQVRVGDYADKTRIVLDLSKKSNYTYDLDNVEKLLIVEVDASAWSAAAGADFAKSPIVASYTAQATDNGKYRLILQLRQAVKVLRAQALPPNADKGDRIVLDLAATQA